MHLGYERRFVAAEKGFDLRRGVYEVACKLGVLNLSDDDEQSDSVSDHGRKLVRFVADACVAGYCYPAALADGAQPFFVGTVGREVIPMALDSEPTLGEDVGEDVA